MNGFHVASSCPHTGERDKEGKREGDKQRERVKEEYEM